MAAVVAMTSRENPLFRVNSKSLYLDFHLLPSEKNLFYPATYLERIKMFIFSHKVFKKQQESFWLKVYYFKYPTRKNNTDTERQRPPKDLSTFNHNFCIQIIIHIVSVANKYK